MISKANYAVAMKLPLFSVSDLGLRELKLRRLVKGPQRCSKLAAVRRSFPISSLSLSRSTSARAEHARVLAAVVAHGRRRTGGGRLQGRK